MAPAAMESRIITDGDTDYDPGNNDGDDNNDGDSGYGDDDSDDDD